MSFLFADTYYFLALVSPGDAGHSKALEFGKENERPILTTAWVFTEIADGLADTRNRGLARQLYEDLKSNPLDQVIPPTSELFELGLDLYNKRPDKNWSLTDCISFIVMQEQGISEALTADRHFQQAGFVALLA